MSKENVSQTFFFMKTKSHKNLIKPMTVQRRKYPTQYNSRIPNHLKNHFPKLPKITGKTRQTQRP
jgi:hypothetical protein